MYVHSIHLSAKDLKREELSDSGPFRSGSTGLSIGWESKDKYIEVLKVCGKGEERRIEVDKQKTGY